MNANALNNGGLRPRETFPLGLIWLKSPRRVDFLGLERALSATARIHKGFKAPGGDALPSAVICCPTEKDDFAAEVSDIRTMAPDATVLVFVSVPELPLARAALRAGARGLLHSGMSPEQVARAVSVAVSGEVVLPRDLLHHWIEEQRPPDLSVLSARQEEILELVVEGLSNAQIARRLFLSESTIKQHLRAAYKALGVRNRNEAASLLMKSVQSRGRSEIRQGTQRPSGPFVISAGRRC